MVDLCKFRNAPLTCQSGCNMGTEPYTASQNAKFPAKVDGFDIKSSVLHSEYIWGIELSGKPIGPVWGDFWHGEDLQSTACICIGLARTIYIRCVYGMFGREFTK